MKSVFNFLYVGYGIPGRGPWNVELQDSFNRIHIPLSSGATVVIDGESYALEEGKVYLLPSHVNMCIGGCEPRKYLHMYIDFYISPLVVEKKVVVMDPQKDACLKDFVDMLHSRMKDIGKGKYIQLDRFVNYDYLEYFIRSMMIYIFATYDVQQLDNDRLARAMSYIYSHFSENITNKDIADSIYVHPRHLTRLFKDELGMTPHQCLTEYRINMARNMLDDGMQIKEVARKCGFEDSNTFRKAFKKMNRIPPLEYNKAANQNTRKGN